jgi:hypothetical protein
MTKYYINENMEKYSIKMAKNTTKKRLHEFNDKKTRIFEVVKKYNHEIVKSYNKGNTKTYSTYLN